MNVLSGLTTKKAHIAGETQHGLDLIDKANLSLMKAANQQESSDKFWGELDDVCSAAEMAKTEISDTDNQDSRPVEPPLEGVTELEEIEPVCSETIESGLRSLRAFSDIEEREIDWLWPSFLPKGAFAVLSGDPGVGKGFLWVDLVARITTGNNWPTGERCETGACLILTIEDNPGSTIKHRLKAAGANQKQAFHLTALLNGEGENRPVNLRFDLEQVERLIIEHKITFVVLDPIQDFWAGVGWNKGEDVRAALMPLVEMLQRTGATCLGICHSNKGDDRSAKDSVAGSKQILASARVAYRVDEIPDSGSLALTVIKNNLAPQKDLNWEMRLTKANPNNVREVPWIDWIGRTEFRANDFTRTKENHPRDRKRCEAKEFLTRFLSDGMKPVNDIKEAASSADIAEKTLERAYKDLGYISKPIGGRFYWMTPEQYQGMNSNERKVSLVKEQEIPSKVEPNAIASSTCKQGQPQPASFSESEMRALKKVLPDPPKGLSLQRIVSILGKDSEYAKAILQFGVNKNEVRWWKEAVNGKECTLFSLQYPPF